MYSVKVRESAMIAHSLRDPFFGEAQNLHGATYVVDVEFRVAELDKHNVVIDICRARATVNGVLDGLRYKNLDELPELAGEITTAEFVARHIHDQVRAALDNEFSGQIIVEIQETHDAWVSYRGPAVESTD